jgi:cytochrome c oxidase subunit 1
MFAATYYWFPLLCGRRMNEQLGRWHFWLSLVGAYGTFLPMHLAGLAGLPRHYAQMQGPATHFGQLLPLQRGISYAAFLLGAAQLIFLANLLWSWRSGPVAGANPWLATTLEWAPAAWLGDPARHIVRGPYQFAQTNVIAGNMGLAQWKSDEEDAGPNDAAG